MPMEGDSKFKELKKSFSSGKELSGKTLGIIGFGKIGLCFIRCFRRRAKSKYTSLNA